MGDELHELEALFSHRYTEADDEFMKTMTTPLAPPPCVKDWYSRPKRQWDWTRGRGRGRGGFDNRDGGYQQRERRHGNDYGRGRSHRGNDNRYNQSYRDRDNYGDNRSNYRSYDNSYSHHHGDRHRNYNQNRGAYSNHGDNYDSRHRQSQDNYRSGPSRTLYPGKKDSSHYPDRNHPYAHRDQRSRGSDSRAQYGGGT